MACDENTFKPLIYSLGWTYIPIKRIGHHDLSKGQVVKANCKLYWPKQPPGGNTHLNCHVFDLKSTSTHRSSIPLPHCTMVRGYGNFHDVSRGLETFWVVGEYLCWTHTPKTSIFGHLRVKADWLSCGGDMAGQDLSEGQGHIPYMEGHVLLEGQGWSPDHPGPRHCLIHSDLNSPWSNIKSMPA